MHIFKVKLLERLLILRVPKHPKRVLDREIQEAGCMIARSSAPMGRQVLVVTYISV